MQNFKSQKKLGCLLFLVFALGCTGSKNASFDDAIAQHRNTLVDQVNPVGKGLSFYTRETLNPIWTDTNESPIVRIPEFTLTNQDGKKQSQDLFKGKISFVTFIFTSCSGFCPTLIRDLKDVVKEVGVNEKDIQYVAVSVDSEADTPEALAKFAKKHELDTKSGKWTLLTGEEKTVYQLARDTFASQAFKKKKEGPRDFAHSEHFYVIDQQGRLRSILNGTRVDTPKEAKNVVSQLHEEKTQVSQF